MVVGGTGLYVRALLRGLWEGPQADWGFRRHAEEEARLHGEEALHRKLAQVDPESAARLHPHDVVKVIRALEVHHLLGQSLSDAQRRYASPGTPFAALVIGLMRERAALYRSVDERVDAQLAKGLVQETKRLLDRGYGRHLGSMKGLGYRQIAGYLAGEYSYDEAVRRLKRDTRHFAKRQLTWFRKEPAIEWIYVGDAESSETIAGRIDARVRRVLEGLAERRGESTGTSAGDRQVFLAGRQ